jgi:hypothetical protein
MMPLVENDSASGEASTMIIPSVFRIPKPLKSDSFGETLKGDIPIRIVYPVTKLHFTEIFSRPRNFSR